MATRGADRLRRGATAFSWEARAKLAPGAGRFRRGVGKAAATLINGCFPGDNESATATQTHRASANPGWFAAHVAEVEVDTLTGRVRLTDYLAAHDIGRANNPMLVERQVHGSIQIGLGYALYEDVAVDPDTGRLRGDSFARYTLANTPEMPPVRTHLMEKAEPTGPFGAKAVGEIATVPVAPALVNAVNAALGTRLTDLPLLPERIILALQN